MQDLSDKLLGKESTKSLLEHLNILNQIFECLKSPDDLDEVFCRISTQINKVVLTDSFHVGLYKAKSETVDWFFTTTGNQLEKNVKFEEDEIISLSIYRKETVYSNLTLKKICSLNKNEEICLYENRILARSEIVSPIVVNDEVFGLMKLISYESVFTARDAFLMSIVASQCGLTLEKFEMEAEIEEKKKLQSMVELANSVGHELNQPLTGITGYCALIKEDLKESDSIYKDIVEIEKQANRLEKLIYKFQNLLYLENKTISD